MIGKLFLSAALTASSTVVLAQTPTSFSEPETIVVTGRRLTDTERALADCLARKCPVDEDVDATLAHAENLFVAGEYKAARKTTKASLHRNRRFAASFPVPVSDLERSNGRISAHLGEKYDFQYSTWGFRRALKQGLPRTDPRLLVADVEIASMLATTGRTELAREKFENAVRDAGRIGRPDLAATIALRLAYFEFVGGDRVSGRSAMEKIATSSDDRTRGTRLAAKLLLAEYDRNRGKADRTNDVLVELKALGLKQPVLIFAPTVRLAAQLAAVGGGGLRSLPTDNFEDKWIDVGFWVRPDGRVEDVQVLRTGAKRDWADPLLRSIAGRLYSPVADNGTEGAFRVERYSYTSFWETSPTGTRIRQREPGARIEYLDLTADIKVADNRTN